MHESRLVVDCLVAACTSAMAIVVLRRFAVLWGLVDHPDQRKQHHGDVPLVGGLAIFIGMAAGAACYGQFQGFEITLLGTAAVLVLLGALDDRFDLSVRDRLLIQTIVILTVIASSGVYIHTLGRIFGHEVTLGWFGVPVTVVAVIGLVKSLALETARSGVTVNAVCPGYADTDMATASIDNVAAKTGKSRWMERLGGNYSASPLEVNGLIYIFSEEGKVYTLEPDSKEYKLLASGELEGRLMASPAVADGAMFVRSDTHLYRIEEK